jgi:UDP-3-O-[3-hydroxymyristoyl] glucosamine N-acyltransferase
MELKALEGLEVRVIRDGEFGSLGLVTHDRSGLLVFLEHEQHLARLLDNPKISCVITTPDLAEKLPSRLAVAITGNPRKIFYEFHNDLVTNTDFYWQSFSTVISPGAHIHSSAYVAEKNVRIGNGTVIEAGVTVLERSIIGDNVLLRAGCTVGSQGFEFKRIGGQILPVAHGGGVRLHDRVEIQANCALSRSVFGGYTEIGEDTKLDNLIHIAHNVRIGKRCLLAASVMVAGSVVMGDDVWVGPGASISSEVTIGDGASITIGSVVTRDVAAGERVTGNFAIPHDKFVAFLRSIR